MHLPRNRLQARMRRALIVIVHHIRLILEHRDDSDGVALRALVGEGLAGLHVEDVWFAVLGTLVGAWQEGREKYLQRVLRHSAVLLE